MNEPRRIKGLPRPAHPGEPVAIDLELFKMTPPLHKPTGEFACMVIAFDGETYMVTNEKDVPAALERLKDGYWIFHNSLFDLRHLRRWAKVEPRPIFDTMMVERDLWGGYYDSFSLADLVRRYFGVYLGKEVRDEFASAELMTPEMEEYAYLDAEYTLAVARAQADEIAKREEGLNCYFAVDAKALWAVLDMAPIRVDVDRWRKEVLRFLEEGKRLEKELGFNVKSPPQTMKALSRMGINVRSTNKLDVLAPRAEHPHLYGLTDEQAEFLRLLISAREYRDAYSKYGESWLEKYVDPDGYVRADFILPGAETGRMASRDPNMQNIPARRMPVYRTFFVASPGHKLVVSDVSMQEPRFTAWLSQDEALLDAIRRGEDLHQFVADAVGGVDRFLGKKINLGLAYGLSAKGLSRVAGIPESEAESLLRRYFERFRGVEDWIRRQRRDAQINGYVSAADGRRIWINPYSRQWQNNALNAPVQSSAAAQTKLALYYIWQESRERGLPFCVCNVVHDEIVADVPEEIVDEYVQIIEDAWVKAGRALAPGIPFASDTHVGDNWGVKYE